MIRKVVMSPEDFVKITDYINGMHVPFADIEKAVLVKEALKKCQVMDIDIKERSPEVINQQS